jgi:hypothetical protein
MWFLNFVTFPMLSVVLPFRNTPLHNVVGKFYGIYTIKQVITVVDGVIQRHNHKVALDKHSPAYCSRMGAASRAPA